jgi:pimeloyl-ACP methyl ester carboxylesterase
LSAPASIEFTGAEDNRLVADLWDGNGHPVLFFHGGGQTRHAWDNTARRIAAEGMRAITVDLRGHGESEWVGSGQYRFADFAEDVAAIIRQVARRYHDAPSAVGASLGGLASLGAELDYGPLLDSLILVDVTPRMDRRGVSRIQGFMRTHLTDGFASLEDASDAISAYLPHRKRPTSLDGLRKNLRLGSDGRYYWHWDPKFADGEYCVNRDAEAFTSRLFGMLPQLHLPVLLVRGGNSELIHEDQAREFVEAVPSGQYVDVSGAGHMVAGDRNDIFCDAILNFLTDEQAA